MIPCRIWRQLLFVLLFGASTACEPEGAPYAPPGSDELCYGETARPDDRSPFYFDWCSDDWALPACYRLVPDPGECPEGAALVGCFYVLEEITGRWEFECRVPAECEPNYVDNPPCCPAELTEATTCADAQ